MTARLPTTPQHKTGPCRVRQFPRGCGKGPRKLQRVTIGQGRGAIVAWLCRECRERLMAGGR